MSVRNLNTREVALAKPVFKDSLPWQRIEITPTAGLKGSLYTMGRTLNVGPYYYQGMDVGINGPELLIHELTHVWQYEHRQQPASYFLDAAWTQVTKGYPDGYQYQEGADWDDYTAEQQAEIVRHWFKAGKKSTDSLFPYIRDVIWTKRMQPDDNRWEKADAATFERRSGSY